MKKYRHKKTGIIASKISTHPRYELFDDDIGDCIIDGRLIENSNDWEEITTCGKCKAECCGGTNDGPCEATLSNKDYEILEYYKPDGKYKNLHTLVIGHTDLYRLEGTNMGSLSTEKELLKYKYIIHKIKRLSDGSKDDA